MQLKLENRVKLIKSNYYIGETANFKFTNIK